MHVQSVAKIYAKLQEDDSLWADCQGCEYCGQPSRGIDHVPPSSVRMKLVAVGLALSVPFVEVPCCRECNSVLGARPLMTVRERRLFVAQALRHRYRSVLAIPNWSDAEIGEMGTFMQAHIRGGLALRDYTAMRLAYATRGGVRREDAAPIQSAEPDSCPVGNRLRGINW